MPVEDEAQLRAAEERVFKAIGARDVAALEGELAADFVHSSPGGPDQDRAAFLQAIREMPYRILEIGGEELRVRVLGDVALVWGSQRVRVALQSGDVVAAVSAFVDVFVRAGDAWRLRHAVSVEVSQSSEG